MINIFYQNKTAFQVLTVIILLFLSCSAATAETLVFNDEQKNIGIYLNEWSDLENFPENPDILAWFENWYGPKSFNKLTLCAKHRIAIPLITWQPQNVPLEEIASGVHDGYILSYLQNITFMVPDMEILIRFAHEMEVRPAYKFSWYSWQGERNPEAYVQAWQHIVSLSRMINPNIKWVWSPNRADQYSDPYYPGDDYVDYVGITMNLRENDPNYEAYDDFPSFYETIGIREHLEQYGKKIIISEVGFSNPEESVKQEYIQSIFDYYLTDPMIAAIIFFDENSGENSRYKISDNPVLLETFNAGFQQIINSRSEE